MERWRQRVVGGDRRWMGVGGNIYTIPPFYPSTWGYLHPPYKDIESGCDFGLGSTPRQDRHPISHNTTITHKMASEQDFTKRKLWGLA